MPAMPDKNVPVPGVYDPELAKVITESARLKRHSAEILKRVAELDEKITARLPGMVGQPVAAAGERLVLTWS
jgi:hypothetical protein